MDKELKIVHGKNILAGMVNDKTSVTEMMQYLGVDPTPELVEDAYKNFAQKGNSFDMSSLYDFLKTKSILSSKEEANKIAKVVDLRK